MKIQFFYLFFLIYFFLFQNGLAQEASKSEKPVKDSELFKSDKILPIKLSFSPKEMRKNTNDSTYIKSELSFQSDNGSWKTIPVELRARGNYRRANCDFPPIRLKIKKSVAKGTLFKGNRKLKLVLPCLKVKNINDDLIKEFIAYKLYAIVSPYHFKTRMVDIDLTELKAKKDIPHELKGIFIERDKNLEKRFHGRELERVTHPALMDTISSVQNAFFQYMIANTDYSTAYQHNQKLFLFDGKIVPVPYDFDMSGLVNARYSTVSEFSHETLPITHVTQRLYRGFERDPEVFEEVRMQYMEHQPKMMEVIDSYESLFTDPKEFSKARKFIEDFFEILADDKDFNREIVDQARTK